MRSLVLHFWLDDTGDKHARRDHHRIFVRKCEAGLERYPILGILGGEHVLADTRDDSRCDTVEKGGRHIGGSGGDSGVALLDQRKRDPRVCMEAMANVSGNRNRHTG